METEKQFCLKWNNHRATLFSVFDTLLEEESLVDVTLSAEGQFLRAHRVILSACSPYFRNMFKSQYLNDKHPVIVIKDMEFDNLKSLVEYMYKGETNVAQPMLPAFIKDAESLQIRGLADFSNKHLEAENAGHLGSIGSSPSRLPQHSVPPVLPPGPLSNSTPISSKKSKNSNSLAGGILAARLAKMSDQVPPPMSMFDFANPETFPSMLRNPAFMAAAASAASGQTPSFPPPMKKSRKSAEPRPRGGSPTKDANKKSKLKNSSSLVQNPLQTNNNFEDMEEGGLKIDEDADPGKENLEAANKMENDDIAEIDNSNGVSEEEEEPSMPGPGGELAEAANEIINPWTGGKFNLSEEAEDNHAQDGAEVASPHMYPIPLMDQISSLNNGRTAGSTASTAGNISAPERDLHTNKYSCNRCGRSYQHQATLVRHQRYECGIQASYPCDICNRKFKRRDVLKGHKEKCVNKVQAQAALASMATAVPQSPGHQVEGLATPVRALSPSGSNPGLEVSSPYSVRPEFHNQTF